MKNLSKTLLKLASEDPSFRKKLIKVASRRSPGSIWAIPGRNVAKKYRAMNKLGIVFGFKTIEEAKNYATGKEDPEKLQEWQEIVDQATDEDGVTDWEMIDDGGAGDSFEEEWGPLAK